MKNVRQFMAVFLAAVLIAGSLPVTLSAANVQGNEIRVSVEGDADTVVDTDEPEKASAAGEELEEDKTEKTENRGEADEADKATKSMDRESMELESA